MEFSRAFSLSNASPKYYRETSGKKKNIITYIRSARIITVKEPFKRLRFFFAITVSYHILT